MKTLRNLVRLHRLRLDEKRKHLGELRAEREGLLRERAGLEAEIAAEMEAARSSLEAGSTFTSYLAAYETRKARVAAAIQAIEERIEAASEDLTEAYRELKRHETLLENRAARERNERDRKERIEQDEIALNIFRRREKENA